MRILIVEDERMVANRLRRLVADVFEEEEEEITVIDSLDDAMAFLESRRPDLVFLDLNLDSEDGFDLLRYSLVGPHQTIVASANTDRAIEAFEHGVIDFIPKPFSRDRLQLARQRLSGKTAKTEPDVKTLPIRVGNKVRLLRVKDILCLQAQGKYTQIRLLDGSAYYHEKTMTALSLLLPKIFFRVHRSNIINLKYLQTLACHRGSRYSVKLTDGRTIPVGRSRIQQLRQALKLQESDL